MNVYSCCVTDLCKDGREEFVKNHLPFVLGYGVLLDEMLGLRHWCRERHIDATQERSKFVQRRLPLLTVVQFQHLFTTNSRASKQYLSCWRIKKVK